MTIADWLRTSGATLMAAEIGSARLDAELILSHVTTKERSWLKAHDDETLSEIDAATATALIARRANHEPLVHLTGTREFYGHDFLITADVLTPRVETEQMVEWAAQYAPDQASVVDIGTGSGAIIVALKLARLDVKASATEVSASALSVAKLNAKRHGVAVEFILSDLWASVTEQFDMVLTNLPYLRDDAASQLMPEVTHEPAVALFGGHDGLDLYRRFLTGISDHLKPGGYLFTECDPWQHSDLIAEAAKYNLTPIEQGYFILGFKQQ